MVHLLSKKMGGLYKDLVHHSKNIVIGIYQDTLDQHNTSSRNRCLPLMNLIIISIISCSLFLSDNWAISATTIEYKNIQAKNIPDNSSTGATSTLDITDSAVPSSAVITSMMYGTLINHTYPSDLKVTLTSPTGQSLTIWNNEGGATDGGMDDDSESDDDILLARTTSFFNGQLIKGGDWTLKAVDSAASDIGSIQQLSLKFVYTTPTVSLKGANPTTVYQGQSFVIFCNFTSSLPSGYKVKIGDNTSTTTMVLAAINSTDNQSSFIASNTTGAHTIYYKLYDSSGNSIQDLGTSSYTVQASLLSPPSGVAATKGTYTDKVRVSWGAVTGATAYQVYRSQYSSSGYEYLGNPSSTSFDDTSATAGFTYYYKVKSYNATSGASELSTSYDSGYRAVATPTVSSFTPPTAIVNQETVFTVNGSNLPSTLTANIQGMQDNCTQDSFSATQVKLRCTPTVTGSNRFFIHTAAGGSTISGSENWYVQVNDIQLPTVTAPTISETTTDLVYDLKATLSAALPTGYYVAINFDNMQGGWYNQADAGGHIPLTASTNPLNWVGVRQLDYPGIRYFRAGIFKGDATLKDGVLQGSWSQAGTCTEQSCIDKAAARIKIGDPEQSGSGSLLLRGVDVATGNFHQSTIDLSVASKGPDFSVIRAYNSLGGDTQAGQWTFNLDTSIKFSNNVLTIAPKEDGRPQQYYKDLTDSLWHPLNPGNFDQLIQNTDGSFTLYTKGNLLYRFAGPTAAGAGRLEQIADRDGNTLVFSHTNNLITGATDANGKAYTITRDTNGRIAKVADFVPNHYVEYTWDSNNMISKARDPRGQFTNYSYSGTRLTNVFDPRGKKQATVAYVASGTYVGKVNSVTDGLGNIWEYKYGTLASKPATVVTRPPVNGINNNIGFVLNSFKTSVIERIEAVNADTTGGSSLGSSTYKTVTTKDRLPDMSLVVKKVQPIGTAKDIVYKDDNKGNPIQITDHKDALTRTTEADWDIVSGQTNLTPLKSVKKPGVTSPTLYRSFVKSGKPQEIVDPMGNLSKRTFDATNGLLTSTTDARNNSTSITNNSLGQVDHTTDALNYPTVYTYDAFGRVATELNARGFTTSYTYDENGNLLTTTKPGNIKTTNTYDASGNLETTTDPRLNTTTYVYDDLNRKIEERYTVGGQQRIRRFAYDAMGRLSRQTNEKGNFTDSQFNAKGQVTKEINPLLESITYEYDINGNVVKEADGETRSVTYQYDAFDRKIKTTDALGNYETYSYNAQGLLASKRDANNRITQYEYDALGRMTKVTDAENGGITRATYDENGNLRTTIDRKNQTTTYTYDKLNRLSRLTDALGRNWDFTYDGNGNMLTRSMPSGQVINYTYDNLDRLTKVVYPGGPTVSYTYDANGNRLSMTDAIGTTNYVYDELNRLTRVTNAYGQIVNYTYDATGKMASLVYPGNKTVSYIYDTADRLKSLTDWLNQTTTYTRDKTGLITAVQYGNGAKVQKVYDAARRLKSLVNRNANNAVISSHVPTLDGVGNPISVVMDLPLLPENTGKAAEMLYDTSNRLTSVGGAAIIHDTDGRVTDDQSGTDPIQYAYNAQDLITTVTKNGVLTDTYGYDGDGRRTQRVSGSETTRYLLDPTGGDLYRVLAETNGSNVVQRYYIYGAGLVAQINGNSHHYYHFDPSGNTLALTDNSGAISDSYAYEPFGNTTSQGTTVNPFRFVGEHGVMDDGNGLQQMRTRYYRPNLRRFVSLDALYGDVDDPMTLNRYQYVSGNPMVGIDPSGMEIGKQDIITFFIDWKSSVYDKIIQDMKAVKIKNNVRVFSQQTRAIFKNASYGIAGALTAYTTSTSVYAACKDDTGSQKCIQSMGTAMGANLAGAIAGGAAGIICFPGTPAASATCAVIASTATSAGVTELMEDIYGVAYDAGAVTHKIYGGGAYEWGKYIHRCGFFGGKCNQ